MRILYIILCICIGFISCKENSYINPIIDTTYIEFPTKTIHQTLLYTETSPYTLNLPFQVFGKSLNQNDTIVVRVTSNYFIKNTDFWYDSIQIITPTTIIDTIHIHIKNTKVWEGGTFSLDCKLISKNNKIHTSKNYQNCTLFFTRESFISYFTGNYSCFENSTESTYPVTFIQSQNDSVLYNTNFWDFPLIGQNVPYIFRKDQDKTIIIPETVWTDKIGNQYTIYGSGNYTFNGTFHVSFFMENNEGKIEHSGIHFFTKN